MVLNNSKHVFFARKFVSSRQRNQDLILLIMKTIYFLSFFSLALFFSSCQDCDKDINVRDETLAVESLLEQYIIANEKQDFNLIQDIWSPDSDIILYGTDTDDRLMGWINIKNAVKDQFSQISETYISVSNQHIGINCTGNTAWFAETLNYNFIYKEQARTYEGLRFTGVVEKIDGKWMLVQAHLSLPAHVGIGK
ncbi:MAG: hypothetical protein CVT99_07640 [Bacteroidetes bacterium HGW-Bacteroidetes-16]|nr:MAG: hypothetical protein CVT99_07640 [Bacteroidetes bacterium HGW-Bacteroidetes-16]